MKSENVGWADPRAVMVLAVICVAISVRTFRSYAKNV